MTGYTIKKEKICIHVVPKCINFGGNHQATVFRCLAKQKPHALVWKNNGNKAQEENSGITDERSEDKQSSAEFQENRKVTPKPVDMELDVSTDWVASPGQFLDISSINNNAPRNA